MYLDNLKSECPHWVSQVEEYEQDNMCVVLS